MRTGNVLKFLHFHQILNLARMTCPMPENPAPEASEDYQVSYGGSYAGKERRDGPKDRRQTDKDRRDLERVADEIAPRRHPEIKGRRGYDE